MLVIIGISATDTTFFELQIAGNDRALKEAFYGAEGGLEVGAELVEQSIWDSLENAVIDGTTVRLGSLVIVNNDYTNLHLNPYAAPDSINLNNFNADAFFSYEVSTPAQQTVPRTELKIVGYGVQTHGGALQQLAGYEGAGKSAASGGGGRMYDIHSVNHGQNNSLSWLLIEWLHAL